ncbi:PREDICTED: trem-like transcript 2 protein isoform X1 [Dipodomys ordii]|uniref:Trem-like transcript 2 protein n=1 Tax=Dipodomys ordii TaxID=10020 RepID=A0A1S3FDN3_DIPOR|nr:PREDICTED: trem-like transcript 2 protein isoform X1 [Dipodomys ordii]
MAPAFILTLLWWLQDVTSGYSSVESLYTRVRHQEGDTLSVKCSYNHRKNRVEDKVWCKVRKRKCEPGFVRNWVQGPHYLLEDDAQAKVVTVTMRDLRRQDSGRYWCMRNTRGTLYPMTGFMLEVSPALTTERDPLLTHPADGLDSGFVTMGHVSTSGSQAHFTSGLLTSSPTTSESARPNSMADYSVTTSGPSWTTESPGRARASSAGPASTPTKSRHVNSGFPATGTYHNHLPSVRPQEPYLTVLVAVLTLLPAPVMFAMVYRFWRKRHMGSYRMSSEHPRPWVYLCRAPEPLWKSA